MLGLKRQTAPRSVIGVGMHVQGDCVFKDALQIDGTVVGNVTAEPGSASALIISETGSVEGSISVDHVVIGGTVVGTVQARVLVELQSKARVNGDVQYRALEMQQGAVIAGQLQPQLTPPPPPEPERRAPMAEAAPAASPPAEPTEPTLDFDRH